MTAFEITHFTRNGSATTGSVRVERTGKVYAFSVSPNGNVMLARGMSPVPANHLRDVRLFVSKRFAVATTAPVRVPQPCQQQQADAGRPLGDKARVYAGCFYASGSRGKMVRALGNGSGFMARGFYFHDPKHGSIGPHLTKADVYADLVGRRARALAAMVPQQAQQQQADAGRRGFIRTALTAGLLATAAAPAALADNAGSPGINLRGDDTARLPDHAALWSRMPLPFTPAEAWRLLSPATQAEIGAAVIGIELAQYVYGDGRAEADQFTDDKLRSDASDVADAILNQMPDRLWTLLPDLYGPDGDHPAWALAAGMVLPLGAVVPELEAAPVPAASADPILATLASREGASQHLARVGAETAGDESPEATALWTAGDRRLAAADDALRATTPTTLAGLSALARHYAATSCDPDGEGLTHLVEALANLADDDPPLT